MRDEPSTFRCHLFVTHSSRTLLGRAPKKTNPAGVSDHSGDLVLSVSVVPLLRPYEVARDELRSPEAALDAAARPSAAC
jgi:hypothetical protein